MNWSLNAHVCCSKEKASSNFYFYSFLQVIGVKIGGFTLTHICWNEVCMDLNLLSWQIFLQRSTVISFFPLQKILTREAEAAEADAEAAQAFAEATMKTLKGRSSNPRVKMTSYPQIFRR
ncbi:hypothetical protein POM88_020385 [Heracleum sosnowskyi]|uniref:Uncharacterized protein n=1 Tax=Heracleum sosnowskyi TaxID=360622 RepID=A0AAD8MN18_9APIA|nr:hypothetical protein POM88_020385 [Heracleum sosnowskyi]